jgi:hypothetical protein
MLKHRLKKMGSSITGAGYNPGKSFLPDGVNDWGDIPHSIDSTFSTEFSLFTWMQVGAASIGRPINQLQTVGGKRCFAVEVSGATNTKYIDYYLYSTTLAQKRYRIFVPQDKPFFSGMTFSNDSLKIYLNGIEIAPALIANDTVATLNSPVENITFGGHYIGEVMSLFAIDTYLDNTTIWNKELNGDAVKELYNSGRPYDYNRHSMAPTGLKLYFDFNDISAYPVIPNQCKYVTGSNLTLYNGDQTELTDVALYGTN